MSLKPDMQADLITIGIISYNAENTIARAIDSCFKQTWPAAMRVV